MAPWQKHDGAVNTCHVRTEVQKDSGSTSGSSLYLPPKSSAQSQTQNQGSDRLGKRHQMEDGWKGWVDQTKCGSMDSAEQLDPPTGPEPIILSVSISPSSGWLHVSRECIFAQPRSLFPGIQSSSFALLVASDSELKCL